VHNCTKYAIIKKNKANRSARAKPHALWETIFFMKSIPFIEKIYKKLYSFRRLTTFLPYSLPQQICIILKDWCVKE
jgi:hypothetical protein